MEFSSMISELRIPKTKADLVKSIQSIQRLDFEVIEIRNQRDTRSVLSPLNKRVSKGPVSVILVQEK